MEKLTAVLVDDIPTALEMLKNDLEIDYPEISILGTASSVVEASKLLRSKQPDILFLDIMLGDGTGFDILEIHPDISSKVIFVTASDEFAIKAFKFAAIDYLLKPYSSSELEQAIRKVKQHLPPSTEQLNILHNSFLQPNKKPTKISLHTGNKILVIDIETIMYCKSDNNYTEFYTTNKEKILVAKTLKYFTDILQACQFLRVHQSYLVNLQCLKEFHKTDGGYIVLDNNQTIPVSVRKKAEVIQAIDNL
ncbi:LytTR family DNA-binding domain-containing protein [Tenacibaculum sp. SG-28]|uniref:LytR/AlgR family response regulator transcription factor n=1 Tax=Tenacibaculum sp. SG-28 TaxID=754426 RepID=UPI000CF38D58|nr:LytTR family DNA-binding domain-containing protein [Tenacibaculum sp. SG-28]PQJ19684.1 DNA-binding response regulator [Tenacibaculum sp. SG-28]